MGRPFRNDCYAPLSHKDSVGDGTTPPPAVAGRSWVPGTEQRRLAAYDVLDAYLSNVSRYYLPDAFWQRPTTASGVQAVAPAEKYREYGHAGLLRAQTRAAVLGETQTIVVDDEDDADPARQKFIEQVRGWLEQWADDERLAAKMLAVEDQAVGLGDGVYLTGFDKLKGRPRLRADYHPAGYFPVFGPDDDMDEYPRTVHVAFAYDEGGFTWLRRKTWRLVELPADVPGRRYPWQPDRESRETVLYSDGVWRVDQLRSGETVETLDLSRARWVTDPDGQPTRDKDLAVDFIPVVHVSNDHVAGEHFGRSILTLVSQVLDDLHSAETDLAENSALVGSTPLVTKGAGAADLPSGPGAHYQLEAGGSAEFLDTSKALDALLKYRDELRGTLATNSRVDEVALGYLNAGDAPSGFALALSRGPLHSLVGELRLVRDVKYRLLLRFVLRFAQQAKLLPEGELPVARVEFGPFQPADLQEAATMVEALLKAGAISTETGVRILVNAGAPIEDAEVEVRRIRRQAFAAAVALAEATGDDRAVRLFLSLNAGAEGDGAAPWATPAPPELPTVELPAGGGGA